MTARSAAIDQTRRLQLRIGVNIGDLIWDETRIYGDGINVAARLQAIAEPGGVCVSEDVYRQTRGKVDSEEARTAAGDIAKGIEGVKNVKNDLQVVAPSARKTVQANDKQITKAVETTFGKDAQLKKIDVRTDAGVVVLSGEVANISTSARASEMAHRVDGVRSVKNELRVAQAKAN